LAAALGVGAPVALRPIAQPADIAGNTTGSRRNKIPTLNDAMRAHIEAALSAAHGRVEGPRGAARILAINPHTLRARMRKLKIDWSAFRDADSLD
jgi:transcriptional regulator with GAF, ATPase, and Fis domain